MKLRFLALLLLVSSASANDAVVKEHSVVTAGQVSGSQSTTVDPDGDIHVRFEFNDRGRGPELETIVRLDDDGVPVHFSISGVNYFKADVSEQFVVEGNLATWETASEKSQADRYDGKFYVPFNTAPEIDALLARALLKSKDHQLDLLPVGTARIELFTDLSVESNGNTLHVSLYGIHGLDTEPALIWLDDSGELFSVDYGWFGIVRKGWESSIDLLKEHRTLALNEHYEDIAADVTTELSGLTVIRGARIFDSLDGQLTDPATVFVWNGVISAIYFEDTPIPDESTVIEAEGKTLIPALWDMHGHVSTRDHLNYLASGITNVRDMGNNAEEIFRLDSAVREGTLAGPDVYPLGFIDKSGEFAAPTGMLADSLDDAIEYVDYYAQHGFRGIKLYSSIEPDWVKPIADYAHAHGMSVAGHLPAYMTAEQAIEAGYDEITHINMLLLNFLGGEELDTRTPARFLVPGEHGGDVSLTSPGFARLIELMLSHGIAHDPTLSVFQGLFRNNPGEVVPGFADIVDHLPAIFQRYMIADNGYNLGKEEQFLRSAEKMMELVELLHREGIQILPGTDNFLPGFTLIRELIYYVEAGIPANEVLQLATIDAARHLGVDQRLGSVTVGKDAHLAIINGNPVEDISSLYRVEHVIKGGVMYSAPDILRAQGFVPF